MSAIERIARDIRCNGCGKESALFARSVTEARQRMRKGGWRIYKNRNMIYDKCPQCKPPQGEGWRLIA